MMKFSHPYQFLSLPLQNRAFIIMLPLTLLAMFIEQVTGGPLKTDVAPQSTVSL